MDGMIAPGVAEGAAAAGPGGAGQPSLLKLLSLQDFHRFVPETLGLLLAVVLVRGAFDASLPDVAALYQAFWIPVLLMAAQYGIIGGLFAACSTSLLVVVTDLPRQSTAQDFYSVAAAAAAQPCAWFAAALVFGGLRTLHLHNQAQLEERLVMTTDAAEDLAERLLGTARAMELLEQRIAMDTATTAVLLDAFARLDFSSSQALITSFAPVIRHGAGIESFAIFLREGPGLVPHFGFENGLPISGKELALLTGLQPAGPGGEEAGGSAAGGIGPALPIRLPIQASDDTQTIGCLVCTRIRPCQTIGIASHRLNEVCRVLAKLLLLHARVPKEQSFGGVSGSDLA